MAEQGEIPISVSVVVPVYSGERYLERLATALSNVRDRWADGNEPLQLTEAIFVDDSAVDGSPAIIDALAERYDWLIPIHLSKNFGQHPATIAGILYSSGNWIVTMDEDLQHPPEKIFDLLAHAVRNSADVVYAQPERAVHRRVWRDSGSSLIKKSMFWLTGAEHVRHINSFRLIRGDIARSAASVAIHDTYFDVELGFFTQRFDRLPMHLTDERYIETGASGYNLGSLLRHAWRMIFSSNLRLLKFATVLGTMTASFALIFALGLIVGNLVWPDFVDVKGWASQMVAVTFFAGVNTVLIGVALQYLSTLVLRAHGRPTFFVVDRSKDQLLRSFLASREA